MKASPLVSAAAVLTFSALAHATPGVGSFNTDAFNLSGALDRELPAVGTAVEAVVGGGYMQGAGGAGDIGSVEDVTGAGGGLELQVGARVLPWLAVGVYGTLARFSRGDELAEGTRVRAATAGVQAVWHTRPSRSLDPWISLGAGWRGLWLTPSGESASSLQGVELARVQLGIDYRFTRWLAIAPVIGASVTMFLAQNTAATEDLMSLDDNRVNFYGFTGVVGRFDVGL